MRNSHVIITQYYNPFQPPLGPSASSFSFPLRGRGGQRSRYNLYAWRERAWKSRLAFSQTLPSPSRMRLYREGSGNQTNNQQACREAVLVLGHRSGRARRTEATVRIRLEKSRLERCTELNLQRTFGPTTMWLGTCWYLLVDLYSGPENGPKVRMNRHIKTLGEYVV